MKAVQVGTPGTAKVSDVGEPKLRGPQDAIVKVTAAAICGADLFPLHGMTPGFDPGTVLGHEFTGLITEVGDAVDLLEVGQRVVSSSMTSDGTCTHCRMGRPAQCPSRALFGYSGVYPRLDGGQAEYVRVPMADRCLLKLPSAFTDEQGLFLADILPTGYAAVQRSGADLTDTIVVLGCGPVGLMALLCVSGFGGGAIAVDSIEARRELAASLGAEAVSPAEAEELVMARTGCRWLRRPRPTVCSTPAPPPRSSCSPEVRGAGSRPHDALIVRVPTLARLHEFRAPHAASRETNECGSRTDSFG